MNFKYISSSKYEASVIMGVNKIDEYTHASITSILNQEGVDCELLIVANGAECDLVFERLSQWFNKFENVRLFSTPIGQLAYALNFAAAEASSDYIVRMDSDDISLPGRIREQLKLIKMDGLDLVGCNVILINSSGEELSLREYPYSCENINSSIYSSNPFCHPSVIYKKDILFKLRGYNAGFNSEDYDLWLRMKRYGVKWGNLDQALLKYRIHDGSTQGSTLAYAEVAGHMLRELLIKPSVRGLYGFLVSIAKGIKAKVMAAL